MKNNPNITEEVTRVAWLLPAMGTGGISFQHLLAEFTKHFPQTIVFTGQWPGYAASFENEFIVEEVGATRYISFAETANGYKVGFSYASPQIISCLLKFKPQIVFANAFTIWTAIAILLKPLGRWKVIVVYEGGSLTYESKTSQIRYQARRWMARLADAFVVNSQAGKSYFLDILQVQPQKVFARPFLVPSVKALLHYTESEAPQLDSNLKRPVFLFVGQVIARKGIKNLLEACLELSKQGCKNYTLLIVGDGEQRSELESFVLDNGLERQVLWVGKIPYRFLGAYFQFADVCVFPTHDDIWGMVLTEAMAFGKAVLCSKRAGAVEMVIEGENGFTFNPDRISEIANLMRSFITRPNLIASMGNRSRQLMTSHTPKEATKCFINAVSFVRNKLK